ncbi:flagellar hook-basal body complex protein [Pseudoneobacillus sp. C159]
MIKSLYSGISGMKGFQTKLDVIGNNIANVNTVGFKKSRVLFQDILSSNMADATAPYSRRGGLNPMQVGLGSRIASIDTVHTPGSPMTTNIGTDVAIDGPAFFVVRTGINSGETYLTKAGNFTLDGDGNLVNANGMYVMGAVTTATTPPVASEVPIRITIDDVAVGPNNTKLKFTSYAVDSNGYVVVVREDGVSGKLARNSSGQYYLSTNDASVENISIATKVVQNPGGLEKLGNSLYDETGNSGNSRFGRIEDIKGGKMYAGVLEMSNVDLTEEFTEMIVAQRGFQANSRTVTTSDSILEEVVNLKR